MRLVYDMVVVMALVVVRWKWVVTVSPSDVLAYGAVEVQRLAED